MLVVNGAPRKSGYTQEMINTFIKGLVHAGADVDRVDLRSVRVAPCRGCYDCWDPHTPGHCTTRDDMTGLLDRYFASDAVVFATPVYFYSFSALLKAFVERLFPLLAPGLEPGHGPNMIHHAMRYPGRGPKKTVLIAVAAHRDEKLFAGIQGSFDLIAKALHLEWVGTLLRPESFFLDFGTGKEKTLRRITNAVSTAGKQLARDGRIDERVQQEVALPLAKDLDNYCDLSASFWKVVQEGQYDVNERDIVKREVSTDPRLVMPSVAGCFDPKMAGDLVAVFNFDITDHPFGQWRIKIENGTCIAEPGLHPTPDVHLTTTKEPLLDIFRNKLDPRAAMSKELLEVKGDIRLFARFGRMFPNPSS